ncbi:MAG: DUF4396 domain-containing protein [Nocardioidaceae bacterium]
MTSHATHQHAHAGHHSGHDAHAHHDLGSLNAMAASATLHCLTGCAIGEVVGLVVGTAAGLTNAATIAISVALAFVFGYTLSAMPLLRSGLALRRALGIVLVADTLSILTMEVVDNLVVAVVPGAMDAGLVNPTFWVSMALALVAAFAAAYPVNRALLRRGQGHALTHEFHGAEVAAEGWRRLVPAFATTTLAAAVGAFLLGGLVVSIAERLG